MTNNKVTIFFKSPFKTIADFAKEKNYDDIALRAVYLNNTDEPNIFENKIFLGEESINLEPKSNEKLYNFL